MIVTDQSSIITFAIPVFMLLILIEYCYGVFKGKSNYKLNDTFTSLSIGMISRYPTMLKDSIKTKKLSNKIKVWFSKTYWRPDDCIEEKDPNNFYKKYNPVITSDIKVFSFLQLIFTGTVSTSVLFFLSQITYNEIFIYAIAITALSSMTGLLLEGKKYMYFVILIFSVLGILSIELFEVLNINILSTTLLSSQLYINILLVCLVYIYQSYQGFSAAKVR